MRKSEHEDFTKPINFTPNAEDAERLHFLAEATGLRGGPLLRLCLASMANELRRKNGQNKPARVGT